MKGRLLYLQIESLSRYVNRGSHDDLADDATCAGVGRGVTGLEGLVVAEGEVGGLVLCTSVFSSAIRLRQTTHFMIR